MGMEANTTRASNALSTGRCKVVAGGGEVMEQARISVVAQSH